MSVNTASVLRLDDAKMDFPDIWPRIEARIAVLPSGAHREQQWVADKLKVRLQVVSNWPIRGVPSRRHAAIAAALGLPSQAITQGFVPTKLSTRTVDSVHAPCIIHPIDTVGSPPGAGSSRR